MHTSLHSPRHAFELQFVRRRTGHLASRLARWLAPCLLLAVASSFAAVDVNRASAQQLQQIKGIGAKTAERIIVERARGPFESLEHLSERLSGIGPKTVIKLRANGLCTGTAESPCLTASTGSSRHNPGHGRSQVTPEILQVPSRPPRDGS